MVAAFLVVLYLTVNEGIVFLFIKYVAKVRLEQFNSIKIDKVIAIHYL